MELQQERGKEARNEILIALCGLELVRLWITRVGVLGGLDEIPIKHVEM